MISAPFSHDLRRGGAGGGPFKRATQFEAYMAALWPGRAARLSELLRDGPRLKAYLAAHCASAVVDLASPFWYNVLIRHSDREYFPADAAAINAGDAPVWKALCFNGTYAEAYARCVPRPRATPLGERRSRDRARPAAHGIARAVLCQGQESTSHSVAPQGASCCGACVVAAIAHRRARL